jgi:hypothetical protein
MRRADLGMDYGNCGSVVCLVWSEFVLYACLVYCVWSLISFILFCFLMWWVGVGGGWG